MEDDLNTIKICFSISLLIRLKSRQIPKISLPDCLILEIAMKKTLKLRFGRQPYNISNMSAPRGILAFPQRKLSVSAEQLQLYRLTCLLSEPEITILVVKGGHPPFYWIKSYFFCYFERHAKIQFVVVITFFASFTAQWSLIKVFFQPLLTDIYMDPFEPYLYRPDLQEPLMTIRTGLDIYIT